MAIVFDVYGRLPELTLLRFVLAYSTTTGKRKLIDLTFSPEEGDLGYEQYVSLIGKNFSLYEKDLFSVVALLGEISSITKKVSLVVDNDLTGYCNHKLNLPIELKIDSSMFICKT